MNGADNYGNTGRQNQLAQWMEFFDRKGLGQPNTYRGLPVYGVDNKQRGLNFALDQLKNEDQLAARQAPTDFFSNQNALQGIMGQPQYAQPQTVGGDNPYMPRAMELTGANYLKRMFGGNPGPRGGTTNGVRG